MRESAQRRQLRTTNVARPLPRENAAAPASPTGLPTASVRTPVRPPTNPTQPHTPPAPPPSTAAPLPLCGHCPGDGTPPPAAYPLHRCAPGCHPRQAATARAAGGAALAAHGPARRLHALPGARRHPCRRRARLSGRPAYGLALAGDRGVWRAARRLVRVLRRLMLGEVVRCGVIRL